MKLSSIASRRDSYLAGYMWSKPGDLPEHKLQYIYVPLMILIIFSFIIAETYRQIQNSAWNFNNLNYLPFLERNMNNNTIKTKGTPPNDYYKVVISRDCPKVVYICELYHIRDTNVVNEFQF